MWLKSRLESSGVRSINNVVDVTNYVLLELGQPLHAFDYDLVEGRKIVVRAAGDGEVIKTLDGVERKLTPEDLLICDGKRPVALAGVMGGANTEVSDGTKNILLESAYFDPSAIRKTSRKTGLKSESSYRFERGVDPNGITKALDRAAELMRELSGGQVAKGRIDEYPAIIEPSLVRLSLETRQFDPRNRHRRGRDYANIGGARLRKRAILKRGDHIPHPHVESGRHEGDRSDRRNRKAIRLRQNSESPCPP